MSRLLARTLGMIIVLLVAANPVPAQDAAHEARLKEIIAGEHRPAENKARDKYRHPLETLQFFGLKPDMTVVEISPGRGWYTEILAPYLKEDGVYYAAEQPANPDYAPARRARAAFDEKMKSNPELYGKVTRTSMGKGEVAPEGSADLILTFRNVHNWLGDSAEDEIFAAMFKALKPGGTLGVVEHRGDPDVPQDPTARSGYVNETTVVALAKEAGFELVERSEINANPKDVKDYPNGVWTLPPSLRLGDKDRDKYLAIGESDRMTLKFVKPAN